MRKFLLIIYVFFALLTACRKSEEDPETTVQNLSGTYRLTGFTATSGGSTIDFLNGSFSVFDDCEKDDLYRFNADNTFNYIDAGVRCDPVGDETGTWSLSGNQISILGGSLIEGTITQFTGSRIIITDTEVDGGVTYTITVIFERQ